MLWHAKSEHDPGHKWPREQMLQAARTVFPQARAPELHRRSQPARKTRRRLREPTVAGILNLPSEMAEGQIPYSLTDVPQVCRRAGRHQVVLEETPLMTANVMTQLVPTPETAVPVTVKCAELAEPVQVAVQRSPCLIVEGAPE